MPGRFLTENTFLSIAFQLPELGLLTFAMFVPMLSGGLNLSIIGTANLTSLFMARLLINYIPVDASIGIQLMWLVLALLGAAGIAVLIGVLTGLMISRVGAHPILVTLGSMTIISGIGVYLTKGAALSGMPPIVRSMGSEVIWGVPVPLIIFIVATVFWPCYWAERASAKISTCAAATLTPPVQRHPHRPNHDGDLRHFQPAVRAGGAYHDGPL